MVCVSDDERKVVETMGGQSRDYERTVTHVEVLQVRACPVAVSVQYCIKGKNLQD